MFPSAGAQGTMPAFVSCIADMPPHISRANFQQMWLLCILILMKESGAFQFFTKNTFSIPLFCSLRAQRAKLAFWDQPVIDKRSNHVHIHTCLCALSPQSMINNTSPVLLPKSTCTLRHVIKSEVQRPRPFSFWTKKCLTATKRFSARSFGSFVLSSTE